MCLYCYSSSISLGFQHPHNGTSHILTYYSLKYSFIYPPHPSTGYNYTSFTISDSNSFQFQLIPPSIFTRRAVQSHWLFYIFILPCPIIYSIYSLPGLDSFTFILTSTIVLSLSYFPGKILTSCFTHSQVAEIPQKCLFCGLILNSKLFVSSGPLMLAIRIHQVSQELIVFLLCLQTSHIFPIPLLVDNPPTYITESRKIREDGKPHPIYQSSCTCTYSYSFLAMNKVSLFLSKVNPPLLYSFLLYSRTLLLQMLQQQNFFLNLVKDIILNNSW